MYTNKKLDHTKKTLVYLIDISFYSGYFILFWIFHSILDISFCSGYFILFWMMNVEHSKFTDM